MEGGPEGEGVLPGTALADALLLLLVWLVVVVVVLLLVALDHFVREPDFKTCIWLDRLVTIIFLLLLLSFVAVPVLSGLTLTLYQYMQTDLDRA